MCVQLPWTHVTLKAMHVRHGVACGTPVFVFSVDGKLHGLVFN